MSPTGPLADWELDLADERLKDVDPEIWECRLRATITERDKRIEAAEKVIVAYDDRHHHQDESLRGLAPRRRAESQVELDAAYATYRERYPK